MLGKTYHADLDRPDWRAKDDGFKTSFKRIKETGRLSKLGRRLQVRQAVGITIQLGERNDVQTQPQEQTRTTISVTLGELIRYKTSRVVDGESRDGVN